MHSNFIQKGRKIKIYIASDPTDISIYGTIDNVEESILEVVIDGTYIQNTIKSAKCILPDDTKTLGFDTMVLGSNNNRIFLTLPDKDNVVVLQRRKFLRVPVDIYVNCYLIGYNERRLDLDQCYYVRLIDIGIGGVRLLNSGPIPIGAVLVFEFNLTQEPMVLTIKVNRCVESLNKKSYELGCQFVGLDELDQQKISTFCIEAQNRNRRNTKIQRS